MKAIRGAITVEKDAPEQVRASVKELLNEIKFKNELALSDVVCIMFSTTDDIHSFYPAKAAREAGFEGCALYSSVEPDISGSLKLCIRVMLLCEIDRPVKHIYLKGAKKLRRDISEKFNIALDGPAGSGKSTIARALAKSYDILYLDTGAMYRAVALNCILNAVNPRDEAAVERLLNDTEINVEYRGGEQITLLNGKNVNAEIRGGDVSMAASDVSAHRAVREKMVELQRKIAGGCSCVLDGRDIGTNVLPNARFKFYVTASAEVRAERRYKEYIAKGEDVKFDDVLSDIIKRDTQDRTREFAPLRCADDAVLIDTSDLTEAEAVSLIKNKIQEKV